MVVSVPLLCLRFTYFTTYDLLTALEVGYGDKAPVTPAGRLLTVVWMIVGVTLCSILSGHMATSFYERKNVAMKSTISSAEDLAGLRVCGYSNTFSNTWYMPTSVPFVAVVRENVQECGMLMQTNEVDVTVMESPTLGYWMRTNPWAATVDLVLSPPLATLPIGLLYSKSSDIGTHLDLKLLELFESPAIRDMQSRWFGGRTVRRDDAGEHVDGSLLWPTVGLLVTYFGLQVFLSIRLNENPCRLSAARLSARLSSNNSNGDVGPAVRSPVRSSVKLVGKRGAAGGLSERAQTGSL